MKLNADKFHSLVSTNNTVKIKIGNLDITNSKSKKLLGVKFDHKLSFDDHISELCKKSSRNAFFKSQFSYCPLVWMCDSRAYNGKINRLHERCLRIIYSDKQSSSVGKSWLCFCSQLKSSDPCN